MSLTYSTNHSIASHTSTKRPQAASSVKPRKRVDLVIHEMDGEALVFDKMTADTHRLNATALFVWNACDGSKQPTQIANDLSDTYDVREPDAQAHVNQAIDTLIERQLVIV